MPGAVPGAVPTNRHKTIPIDFGPISGWFHHDTTPLNLRDTGVCEIKAAGPYGFIGFGAMDVTKSFKFIWFGDIHGSKPYEFIRSGGFYFANTGS